MRAHRLLAVPAFAGLLFLAACAPADEGSADPTSSVTPGASPSPTAAACSPQSLATKTAGTLTIGTDKPAYPPYFVDDDPSNGKGFESAVAYAVAEQLGYTTDEVTWVVAAFGAAIQPGPKPFDIAINQFSITEERKNAVDFSSSYYDAPQAVITVAGSKAAAVTDLAGLKDLKIGVQVGTTSFDAIQDVIKPSSDPAVFNSNDDAKVALTNGQVDALVVDLPTALYITAAELDNGKLVGQLEGTTEGGDQFGLVLDKDSSLTACVTQAVDALRADGTLAALETEWLTEAAEAPVLK